MIKGLVIKAIGGFYYVETADGKIYECKARGVFRKDSKSPLVGDMVDVLEQKEGYPVIERIMDRKNQLIRPPISNIDRLIIVASVCDPSPNTLIIDKMIAIACNKGIKPILVLSKTDLNHSNDIYDIYIKAGIKTIKFSLPDKHGIDEIKNELKDGLNVFTGNTGVGKSSLLNCIDSKLSLATGKISYKLGRGKHTTRHVELYKIKNGVYVADTPGFSSVDIEKYELIDKDELQYCFKEFAPYIGECRFNSCTHRLEKGCSVIKAVLDGEISKSRHASYVSMYNELKDIKKWELK